MPTSPLPTYSTAHGRDAVARVPGPRGGARPMLASPGDLPRGAGWAFEFVWSGLRCLAHAGSGELRLVDGEGHDVTAGFPELGVPAAPGLVLDGVVVALDAVGRPEPGAVAPPSAGAQRRPARSSRARRCRSTCSTCSRSAGGPPRS